MKQTTNTHKPRVDGSPSKAAGHELTVGEYIPVLMRGKWTILLWLIAVTGAAALYTFTAKPVYESTARVMIDLQTSLSMRPFSSEMGGSAAGNRINNELEILQSQSMLQSVAGALLERKTLVTGGNERIPIIQSVSDGESPKTEASQTEVMGRIAGVVKFMPVRESDVIKISARSVDPREAALLANVYAETYVERNTNASRNRSRSVREFLQSQRDAKKKALDTTEAALQRYMQTSGTVALDDETRKVVSQMAELEARRDANAVEMSSRQKTLLSYREELERQEPAVARSIGESNDTYVRLLQEELATLEVQRDVIIAQNPTLVGRKIYEDKLKEINKQIGSLQVNLKNRTSEFLKSLVPSGAGEGGSAEYLAQTRQRIVEQQIELDALVARDKALRTVIADYESQFRQIPQKSIDLAKYQRARLGSERLYLLVDEKYNDALITEKSEFGYVDIIDPALVSTGPVSPRIALNIILGAVLGLVLGVAFVVVRDRRTPRIRTPDDLRRFGVPSVSTVSRMVEEDGKGGKTSVRPGGGKAFDPHLISYHNPLSVLAESYRLLRTNVQYALLEAPLRSILVTSANPSEGKSTSAANLAITFAQTDRRVLLVDADLRRPSLHRLFNTPRAPGLNDFVREPSNLDQVVRRNVMRNLDIVCSGAIAPNPAEIADSQGMRTFIKLASQTYDIVLFDSSPLLAVTDAAVISREVDGTILVVSSGDTLGLDVERALEVLKTVGSKVLGVLLNNFDPVKAYGGYYGPYRRSKDHYSDYIQSFTGEGDKKRGAGKV